MKTQKGKFIVIDGSEGAGKSSQLKKLAEKLLREGRAQDFVLSREPGGTPYAEEIRDIILNSKNASQANAKTHFALFWAARADHMKNKIIPALEAGKHVIVDRFDSSTFAYQIFGQEAKELKDEFFAFRNFFLGDYKPDIYIYLDVDTEIGLSRKTKQGEVNYFENRKIEFFNRMREGFAEFFENVSHQIIDANKSFEQVANDLEKVLFEITKN